MTPDSHGYIRVFVGGKHAEWHVADGDADTIVLRGSGRRDPDPNQLTFADDGDIDIKDLGGRHDR